MAKKVGNGIWPWYDMQADLEEAGAKGIQVDSSSTAPNFSGGSYKGRPWSLSWEGDQLVVLSLPQYDSVGQELTRAFAEVFEYGPFCRYRRTANGPLAVEWAKRKANNRYAQLRANPEVKELVKM